MGYICTRCGGTNVVCEAIVNPNTGKIIDYLNEKLIEVFEKGITVKLKYVEKRVLDAFTDNGIDLSNYTHCIIVKRNFYLAW